MSDAPEHRDPQRYVELAGFETGYRDLWWNSDWLALLARRLSTVDADAVLDVGCGSGEWGRTVIRHLAPDATLTGVDREEHFLGLARSKARTGDTFHRATAEALPFEDASFDLVTCQTVLIHVADAQAVVAEMARVTKPGGVVILAEPDNLAGNLAWLGGSPAVPDDDVVEIAALLVACHRGKAELGEGDERVGARLPGLLTAAGLTDVTAYTNDRCMTLVPPYQTRAMKLALQQELAWIREGTSVMIASKPDARRLARAAGRDDAAFERGWSAMARWMQSIADGVAAGLYHSTRGFVMVVSAGRKASPRGVA